jgi:hypothetical protein
MMVAEHHFTMLLPGGSFCLRAKALGGGSPGAFPFGRGFLAQAMGIWWWIWFAAATSSQPWASGCGRDRLTRFNW